MKLPHPTPACSILALREFEGRRPPLRVHTLPVPGPLHRAILMVKYINIGEAVRTMPGTYTLYTKRYLLLQLCCFLWFYLQLDDILQITGAFPYWISECVQNLHLSLLSFFKAHSWLCCDSTLSSKTREYNTRKMSNQTDHRDRSLFEHQWNTASWLVTTN